MQKNSGYNVSVSRFLLQDETPVVEGSKIRKMQVCRAGKFSDPRYGEFEITIKMFNEMIQNFNDKVRGIVPALDYKHESDDIAAGWFKSLYIENGNELWADIEMTPKGSRVLADKEFGYVSIDFETGYTDNETKKNFGSVLHGAGLTNRPVVKRMQPVVQLSEKQKELSMSEEESKKMSELEAKCMEYEVELAAMKKKMESMIPAKKEEEVMPEANKEIEAELATAKKELAEANAKLSLAEKTSEFTKLLSEGKACEAQREAFIKGDMAAFIAGQVAIKLTEQGHASTPAEDTVKTESQAEEKVLEEAKKLSDEKKISMKEAISEVLISNPKLAEQIR